MRVIAGAFKGRRLEAPTWEGLRPTSDRLRETLFNILAPRVRGARVLDGYAGTGALGIEAISRGAAQVTFVEQDRRAQALIARNLAHCGVENGYAIIRASLLPALADLSGGAPFDIVMLDPPYASAGAGTIEGVLEKAGTLMPSDGTLILEHARKREPPRSAGRLALVRAVKSGDSALAIYACQP